MSNNQHRSHKRQKSSISNPGYYFNPNTDTTNTNSNTTNQQARVLQQQQPPPPISHQNMYDHDSYIMNYNFPPSQQQQPQQQHTPYTSTNHTTSDLTHESHSVHTSPLKRSASTELDTAISTSSPIINPSASTSSYYYPPQQQQQQQNLHYQDHSHSQQHLLHSNQPPLPLFATPSINPSSMQPNNTSSSSSSSSYAFNQSHSSFNPPLSSSSAFDSSNLYNSAFRLPDYPVTNPSKQLQQSHFQQHHQQQLQQQQQQQQQSTGNTLPTGAAPVSALRQHQKNNLSISSHLTLFSLNSSNNPPPPRNTTNVTSATTNPTSTDGEIKESSALFNDLLYNLTSVDGSNINNFLLSILRKINLPFTLDDFYNLLYNDRQRSLLDNISYQNKIDKTIITNNNNEIAIDIINQLLNVFKNPNLLLDYYPNLEDKDNKLININYHELLRTFLAIKILFDILIQLPLADDDDPQNYTIPRLSIYKTYYIICQKLIASYPSASNTKNEQQKLILGQSKLGKLIKLVYPNLLIKRLGSRGESKYNYLGVMWNNNIVQHEIKQLCDDHELNDLNEIFNSSDHNNPFLVAGPAIGTSSNVVLQSGTSTTGSSTPSRRPTIGSGGGGGHHRRNSSKSKMKLENNPFLQTSTGGTFPLMNQQQQQPVEFDNPITSPRLSFIKSNLKYPMDANASFSILDENNWFLQILYQCYNYQPTLDQNLIQQIFLKNEFLLTNSSLLRNLMDLIIKPLAHQDIQSTNIDLTLYLVIILEILPYLLLVKSSTNINLLKNLRLNLLHLINNLNNELKSLNSPKFTINNSTIFLIVIKKLINLNDLLITFIKLINKDQSKVLMSNDIENFLKINSQTIKFDNNPTGTSSASAAAAAAANTTGNSEDSSFFFNLNTNSMGEVNFSFKNDILSNDLIYTLIGYNFDPNVNHELKNTISMNFINKEINIIDQFFKNDLLDFLNTHDSSSSPSTQHHNNPGDNNSVSDLEDEDDDDEDDDEEEEVIAIHHTHTNSLSPDPQSSVQHNLQSGSRHEASQSEDKSILSRKEMEKLNSLINLIDKKLLNNDFKEKYPILMYNNCICYILNDILKYIFLKQQQLQLNSALDGDTQVDRDTQSQQRASNNNNNNSGSFGNWWVFNSFVQEYMSLIGEIVGLHDLIH
ncbi:RFX2 RFX-like DNA-binding protein RFX2 [Candida maltosa Xu316]